MAAEQKGKAHNVTVSALLGTLHLTHTVTVAALIGHRHSVAHGRRAEGQGSAGVEA